MPKNPVLESITHHIFAAARRSTDAVKDGEHPAWKDFFETVNVSLDKDRNVKVVWGATPAHELTVKRERFALYMRGDEASSEAHADPQEKNQRTADEIVEEIRLAMGLANGKGDEHRLHREESFHDEWAALTRPEDVLVLESFEASTAPENRFILERLGDLRGKKVLDIGCGLGEASVYFALKGADVTASDLSGGMLKVTAQVAERFGVKVHLHQNSADSTNLPDGTFDIVYAANVLHHSDIAATLDEAKRLLKPGGLFASVDPLAHNPVINVYRRMAEAVRSVDEHPLKIDEIRLFKERFSKVDTGYFWLTTLVVFIFFYVWDRVDPSKERYWKRILTNHKRLEWFYRPLEKLDRVILAVCPWLRRHCWNVAVVCTR